MGNSLSNSQSKRFVLGQSGRFGGNGTASATDFAAATQGVANSGGTSSQTRIGGGASAKAAPGGNETSNDRIN
jgi:hypothetical protein